MTDPRAKDSDDKDYRWLVARERGEDMSHVSAAERAPYEQIGALVGSGLAPRAGFRQRVLDAIDAEERRASAAAELAANAPDAAQGLPPVVTLAPVPVTAVAAAAEPAEVVPIRSRQPTGPAPERPAEPKRPAEPGVDDPRVADSKVVPIRKKSPWRWIAAGGLAAAAAAAVLFATSARRGAEAAPQLAVKSERRAGPKVRSAEGPLQASLGDRIIVRAQVPASGEVRVYGGSNEQLLKSCKHPGDCALEGDGAHRWLVLEVELTVPGPVRTVVFAGEHIPASTGAYQPDIDATQRAQNVTVKEDENVWNVL